MGFPCSIPRASKVLRMPPLGKLEASGACLPAHRPKIVHSRHHRRWAQKGIVFLPAGEPVKRSEPVRKCGAPLPNAHDFMAELPVGSYRGGYFHPYQSSLIIPWYASEKDTPSSLLSKLCGQRSLKFFEGPEEDSFYPGSPCEHSLQCLDTNITP